MSGPEDYLRGIWTPPPTRAVIAKMLLQQAEARLRPIPSRLDICVTVADRAMLSACGIAWGVPAT